MEQENSQMSDSFERFKQAVMIVAFERWLERFYRREINHE